MGIAMIEHWQAAYLFRRRHDSVTLCGQAVPATNVPERAMASGGSR